MTLETFAPGPLVKAARIAANKSRKEIAAVLGCSFRTIVDIETDRKQTSLDRLRRVALAIGCDPHDIHPHLASDRRKYSGKIPKNGVDS
jgi:transcriptional regulator with XRE-family HTH domain